MAILNLIVLHEWCSDRTYPGSRHGELVFINVAYIRTIQRYTGRVVLAPEDRAKPVNDRPKEDYTYIIYGEPSNEDKSSIYVTETIEEVLAAVHNLKVY